MVKLSTSLCVFAIVSVSSASGQDTVAANPTPAPIAPPTPAAVTPAPIEPPIQPPTQLAPAATDGNPLPTQLQPAGAVGTTGTIPMTTPGSTLPPGAARLNDFQGDPIDLVLRTLARQANINIVVSDKVATSAGTVNMRIAEKSPKEAIEIIVESKGLVMDQGKGGVYYIKTTEEKAKEPTESGNYTFSYGSAEKVVPLLQTQLQSGVAPQFDGRTNTIFFRENRSNLEKIKLFLESVDRPTQQVMIEARLVEVTANPTQAYGINWSGVVGNATQAQTFRYSGSGLGTTTVANAQSVTTSIVNGAPVTTQTPLLNANGLPIQAPAIGSLPNITTNNGLLQPADFLLGGGAGGASLASLLQGQFAILSVPNMSATLRLMNNDADAEFLAHPRIVTANNTKATIEITRAQPVPQLNFNEQTAQAVFSGFQDKKFGNTLVVTPSINKDDFVTMNVQPEISNKVADATFTFSGATVTSPVIDTRKLDSNVLIKSGDTLAIGGLLQDEVNKTRTKVPVLGDIPILGYAFQERLNARVKRNLLIFVTPTIIHQGYGTGLEDQVTGLNHSGEEYADPNGWRNNARGAVRLVPTSERQVAADYPKPGVAPAPKKVGWFHKKDKATPAPLPQ